jgi:hypothetical protein
MTLFLEPWSKSCSELTISWPGTHTPMLWLSIFLALAFEPGTPCHQCPKETTNCGGSKRSLGKVWLKEPVEMLWGQMWTEVRAITVYSQPSPGVRTSEGLLSSCQLEVQHSSATFLKRAQMSWPEEAMCRDVPREPRELIRASSCSDKLLVKSSPRGAFMAPHGDFLPPARSTYSEGRIL